MSSGHRRGSPPDQRRPSRCRSRSGATTVTSPPRWLAASQSRSPFGTAGELSKFPDVRLGEAGLAVRTVHVFPAARAEYDLAGAQIRVVDADREHLRAVDGHIGDVATDDDGQCVRAAVAERTEGDLVQGV